ncbi:hypothetical protein VQL36_01675 [Chengkuizengella sp. SCS-71B]|uniref:hypothetical protein n=1 Tax=Chengkuizengella sp. SCS-71B TaxID=3115290 RepID=UPI0032C24937
MKLKIYNYLLSITLVFENERDIIRELENLNEVLSKRNMRKQKKSYQNDKILLEAYSM